MKMHHVFIGFFTSFALAVIFGVGLFVRAYEPSTQPKLINAGTPRIFTVGWNAQALEYLIVSAPQGKVSSVQPLKEKEYDFNLSNGNLIMRLSGRTIWQTPVEWQVSGYALADVNHDGKIELNISVWKPGDFGPSKPAWVNENDMSVKNHLFVYELTPAGAKAIWQSSNLDQPTCEFIFADLDRDQKQELAVIEGEYTATQSCRGKYVAIWKWDEWGFYNQWRSREGHFNNLRVIRSENDLFLQADLNIY